MSTRKRRTYQKNFFFVSSFIIIGVFLYMLFTGQFKVTLAKDISSEIPENYSVPSKSADLTIDELISEDQKNVVFVSSNWCGACDLIRRSVETKAEENPGINFYELDLDLSRDLVNEMDVTYAPAAIFFANKDYKTLNGLNEGDFEQNMNFLSNDLFVNIN